MAYPWIDWTFDTDTGQPGRSNFPDSASGWSRVISDQCSIVELRTDTPSETTVDAILTDGEKACSNDGENFAVYSLNQAAPVDPFNPYQTDPSYNLLTQGTKVLCFRGFFGGAVKVPAGATIQAVLLGINASTDTYDSPFSDYNIGLLVNNTDWAWARQHATDDVMGGRATYVGEWAIDSSPDTSANGPMNWGSTIPNVLTDPSYTGFNETLSINNPTGSDRPCFKGFMDLTDLLSIGLTDTNINDDGFGFGISLCQSQTRYDHGGSPGDGLYDLKIYAVSIAVYYTGGDGGGGDLKNAKIKGTAYLDVNHNYSLDTGEPPMGLMTIDLYDNTSKLLAEKLTATDGTYEFDALAAGTYHVAALSQYANAVLETPSPLDVTLTAGAESDHNDFGYVIGPGEGIPHGANCNNYANGGALSPRWPPGNGSLLGEMV